MDEHQQVGNFILDSLPQAEYERLRPHLEPVTLQQGEILVRLRQPILQVYFPVTAVVSWVNATADGDTIEVGMTGFEGVIGSILLFNQKVEPWEVEVQLTGDAYQLSVETFMSALQHCSTLRQKVGDFAYLKMMHLTQSALCNRFHATEQRLCRWLLATHDRTGTLELLLTRDLLAKMIGSTRPAVSIITGTLQSAGLIRAGRGKVTILDREEMKEATCECYHIIKQQFDNYLHSDRAH
jgi:CRP-like cAMP-binding protein